MKYFLITILALTFYALPTLASEDIDFDDYNLGSIHLQDGWNNSVGSVEVVGANCESGKCIKTTSTGAWALKNFNPISSGNVKLSVMIPTGASGTFLIRYEFYKELTYTGGSMLTLYGMYDDELDEYYLTDKTFSIKHVIQLDQYYQVLIGIDSATGTYNMKIGTTIYNLELEFTNYPIQTMVVMGTGGYIDNLSWEYRPPLDQDAWTPSYFTLDDTRSDFFSPIDNICYINEECTIIYYYNKKAVGKELFFIIDDGNTPQFPEYATSSKIIPETFLGEDTLLYPEIATTTTELSFCYYLVDNKYTDVLKCGMNLKFVNKDTWIPTIIKQKYCDESVICGDIEDTFFYGIECGFKKVICWAFEPTPESVDTLKSTVTKLENSFPFNTVFSVLNHATETIEEKTSESGTVGGEFGLIMVDEVNGGYTTRNFIDSDTFNDTLGSTTVNKIETGANYVIWITAGAIILFVVINFAILKR